MTRAFAIVLGIALSGCSIDYHPAFNKAEGEYSTRAGELSTLTIIAAIDYESVIMAADTYHAGEVEMLATVKDDEIGATGISLTIGDQAVWIDGEYHTIHGRGYLAVYPDWQAYWVSALRSDGVSASFNGGR